MLQAAPPPTAPRFGKRSRKSSTATQEEAGRLTSILTESFERELLVKAYGMEDRETTRVSA